MTESVFGTLRRVMGLRKEIGNELQPYPVLDQEKPIDPSLFKYFFDTQVAIEKEGAMNYHTYASKVWQDLVSRQPSANLEFDPQFKRFESNLVLGLQDIDMRKHTYSELTGNLGQLIAKHGQSIRKVAIWTTGDNSATGYQPAKVARTNIISAISQAIKTHLGEGHEKMRDAVKTNEFIAAKTAYIVSDNKFAELDDYLNSQSGPTKLVVIEDSRKNLEKVKNMVKSLNENRHDGDLVEFISIWATYSREGIQAKEKAEREGATVEFASEKQALNAIDSPKDLLDDRFKEIFAGADVLVDFDGVIGNNITMREAQGRVKYNVLVGAVMERDKADPSQANKTILDNLDSLQ